MHSHRNVLLMRCGRAALSATLLSMLFTGMALAADTTGAANVPALTGEPLAAGSLAKMALGLFAVVFLLVGMAWLMRRMGGIPGTSSGALRVLGGLSMGTRERVVLIQVGETQLLLGVAPGRVETLYVLDEPITPAETGKPAMGNFAANLSAALQRGKKS